MNEYPSIPAATGTAFREFDAHVFDKLDGQNTRWELRAGKGWKAGTRTRRFDASDPEYGPTIALFAHTLAEPLERIARKQRLTKLTVFAEWHGPNSFIGIHRRGDPMTLTVFDAEFEDRGLLGPSEFRKLFEDVVATPRYLGSTRWTRGLVERVRAGEIDGMTFEGVVGKAAASVSERRAGRDRAGLIMAKAKTQAWVDKVHSLHDPATARRILES